MTILRIYTMRAAAGRADDLVAPLERLEDAVRAIDGCEGVTLARDQDDDHRFVVIQRWATRAAHGRVRECVSPQIIADVFDRLEGRPQGSYLDIVRTV